MTNILITVLGSSPAILTETLYALIEKKRFPTQVHILTTDHGVETFDKLKIQQCIERLCDDYNMPKTLLKNMNFHVAKHPDGTLLNDIRDEQDQVIMADEITSVVRTLTADKNTVIDASIAGGRKSMSFYMGYIFSMFAREQDILSHVLVDPVYENTNFFYPTVDSQHVTLLFGDNKGEVKIVDGQPLDAMDAKSSVLLAEIPFIRLNQSLQDADDTFVAGGALTYSDCIKAYNLSLTPELIRLTVNPKALEVTINEWRIMLPPEHMALYSIMLEDTISGEFSLFRSDYKNLGFDIEARWMRSLAKLCDFNVQGVPIDDFEAIVEQVEVTFGSNNRVSPNTVTAVADNGLTYSMFDRLVRDIKEKIATKTVGNVCALCQPCVVSVAPSDYKADLVAARKTTKSKSNKRAAAYGVRLNPNQITLL